MGMFYLHKGDVDAAIDRFLDAIQQRPNFAKPRLLLGKAYEKKHDNESAVKYYKEYLQGAAWRARRERSPEENRETLERVAPFDHQRLIRRKSLQKPHRPVVILKFLFFRAKLR